ncbi:MAG: DUF4395 domain-containing protein [Chitinophagales bacterium]|nr:DUF4395 domain-containing protein [Chitinophagales bacterium]
MTHICPVNGEKINEPTVRTVAGIVVILAAVGIYFQLYFIFLLLSYDFFVRGFYKREFSLLRFIAIQITNQLNFKEKLIDAAPKRFAAKIGFIFSVIILSLLLLQHFHIALMVTIILIVCAILESVFAYCLGCQFYSIFISVKDYFQKSIPQ